MKKTLLTITLTALTLLGSANAKTDSVNILFILDGSGSMWGQVEGRHKIVIAKEVMTGLVQELSADIRAGLQVYGHRSKGDCQDIEILVPVGADNREALVQQIEAITPRGKTPITQSFQHAADQLRALEDETTVVLVSDGKETCEGDPCTLVRELREQGIKIKVHVVGFDVTNDESEQLVCIAEAGGGKYFSANNTVQLQEALTEVKQEIVAKVDPRPARCETYAQTAVEHERSNVENECGFSGERWNSDYAANYAWCMEQSVDSGLPDTANNERIAALQECKVKKATVKVKKISIGKPGTFVFNWPGKECWGVYRGGTKVSQPQCGKGKQGLQAGTYTVKANHKPAFEPFEVTIQKGETKTVDMGGMLVFNWPGKECWGVYRGGTKVSQPQCGKGKQGLQAGTYTVKANHKPAFEPFEVTIEDGQTLVVE